MIFFYAENFLDQALFRMGKPVKSPFLLFPFSWQNQKTLVRNPESELSWSFHDLNDRRVFISRRELDVLKMIAEGFRNAEIAEKLYISPFTVKKHISNAFEKLDVHSRIKAIEKAKELKIL